MMQVDRAHKAQLVSNLKLANTRAIGGGTDTAPDCDSPTASYNEYVALIITMSLSFDRTHWIRLLVKYCRHHERDERTA